MPPKVKITKQEIVAATLSLLREQGEQAMNARSIAAAIGCSTQPIFSNFDSLDDLQKAVYAAAYDHYYGFLTREMESGQYPPYKAFGMAYIRFAKEEKQLFRVLFMCDRKGQDLLPSSDYSQSVDMIMKANGISKEEAERWHLEMWCFVHGIGTILATSYLSLDPELISSMLSDVYHGLRAKYVKEETV
ncbi:MAG: TetR/AcrR family transcriptional regulator [Clostridia bacterium]|nr:TetR/AcrR family transcriptional regulator [Clostridia bacterium]